MLGNYFELIKGGCTDDKANYHWKVAINFFLKKIGKTF